MVRPGCSAELLLCDASLGRSDRLCALYLICDANRVILLGGFANVPSGMAFQSFCYMGQRDCRSAVDNRSPEAESYEGLSNSL